MFSPCLLCCSPSLLSLVRLAVRFDSDSKSHTRINILFSNNRSQPMRLILSLCLAFLSLGSLYVKAIPTWDMFTSRSKVGDLVPGSTIIHAYGPTSSKSGKAKFLRSNTLPGTLFYQCPESKKVETYHHGHGFMIYIGLESNVTVTGWVHEDLGPPSKFFVSNGALYQITNQTTILYANLLNATDQMAHRTPKSESEDENYQGRTIFRLALSSKRDGLVSGSWEWYATLLQYRLGNKSNNGLFYKCTETNGDTSVYVPLDV